MIKVKSLQDEKKDIVKPAYHVGRPNMPKQTAVLNRFKEVLENKWLTNMGPMSLELEERIADLLEVKHCICVSNATIGLELLQRALDITGRGNNSFIHVYCNTTLAELAKNQTCVL